MSDAINIISKSSCSLIGIRSQLTLEIFLFLALVFAFLYQLHLVNWTAPLPGAYLCLVFFRHPRRRGAMTHISQTDLSERVATFRVLQLYFCLLLPCSHVK